MKISEAIKELRRGIYDGIRREGWNNRLVIVREKDVVWAQGGGAYTPSIEDTTADDWIEDDSVVMPMAFLPALAYAAKTGAYIMRRSWTSNWAVFYDQVGLRVVKSGRYGDGRDLTRNDLLATDWIERDVTTDDRAFFIAAAMATGSAQESTVWSYLQDTAMMMVVHRFFTADNRVYDVSAATFDDAGGIVLDVDVIAFDDKKRVVEINLGAVLRFNPGIDVLKLKPISAAEHAIAVASVKKQQENK